MPELSHQPGWLRKRIEQVFELSMDELVTLSLAIDARIETLTENLQRTIRLEGDVEFWQGRIDELKELNTKLGFVN